MAELLTKQPYPALDVDGWIRTPTAIADKLISDFFLSEYSQTENFPGHVLSFPWLLKEFQDDSDGLTQAMQTGLVRFFNKYFWDTEIQVEWKDEENSINKQMIIIYMVFKDRQGKEYNIARIAKGEGANIQQIINVINEG